MVAGRFPANREFLRGSFSLLDEIFFFHPVDDVAKRHFCHTAMKQKGMLPGVTLLN